MTIFLGEQGLVRLRRTAEDDGFLSSVLDADDVNAARRRFSFDFDHGALVTGDEVEIRTEDGSMLELVAGHNYPDGRWYMHVDDAGGIRLYRNFEDAINGGFKNAVDLVVPTRAIPIAVRTRMNRFRCLAQMRSWEFTTSRAAIDTTVLGDEFVNQFSRGLISGQGQLSCLWDYRQEPCDPMQPEERAEEANYLCQLLLRLQQGARFDGEFYITSATPAVWYSAACIVTNVAMSFAPGAPVESRVEFVTSGRVELHTGQPDAFLLQQSGDTLLLEEHEGALLLEDPT